MKLHLFLAVPAILSLRQALHAETISGLVTDTATSAPIAEARVTLFSTDLRFFREVRTSADGRYNFTLVSDGSYQLGVAALRRAYAEQTLTVGAAALTRNLALTSETHPGQWTIVGSTTPELLEGTGSASVLPTGEVIFCHDTIDPVVFDTDDRDEMVSAHKRNTSRLSHPHGFHIRGRLLRGRLTKRQSTDRRCPGLAGPCPDASDNFHRFAEWSYLREWRSRIGAHHLARVEPFSASNARLCCHSFPLPHTPRSEIATGDFSHAFFSLSHAKSVT